MAAAAFIAALVACAASAAPLHTPVLVWTTAPDASLAGFSSSVLSADDLAKALRASRRVHAFTVSNVPSHKFGSLLATGADAARLGAQIRGAPSSLLAPRVGLADGSGSTLAAVFRANGCAVVAVGTEAFSGSDRLISREQYAAEAVAVDDESRCTAFVVAVTADSMRFVADAATRAGSAGAATLLLAPAAPAQDESADEAAAAGFAAGAARPGSEAGAAGGDARRLAGVARAYVVGRGIMMTPDIFTGLAVGLLLLFFALIGLNCVASVQTPDVLHAQTLMAGKEY